MIDNLVSIVLPAYNAGETISHSIESILGQTYKDLEIIIVNDGSTDKTIDVANFYRKLDSRIYILDKECNEGLISALNDGIRMAKGEFIARMDADDISLPCRIEKQVDLLRKGYDIVGGKYEIYSHKGRRVKSVPITEEEIRLNFMIGPPFAHGSVTAKADLFKRYTYSKTAYDKCEDYYLWYRLISSGYMFGNVNECIYQYFEGSKTLSRNNYNGLYNQTRKLANKWLRENRDELIVLLSRSQKKYRNLPPYKFKIFAFMLLLDGKFDKHIVKELLNPKGFLEFAARCISGRIG